MITVSNLSYSLDNEVLLDDFSYIFPDGSLTGILATVEERISFLLQIICGITEPSTGKVLIDGTDLLNGTPEKIRDVRRSLSFVFNRGGLISNLSILENLLLPLDYHFPEMGREAKLDLITRFLNQFSLQTSVLNERPAKLHPQIAKMLLLIRAFLPEPRIILYDNPLGDLEYSFRKKIFSYISTLQSKNVTQIFVSTSDILLEIADIDLVFKSGKLIESGQWNELLFSQSPVTQRIIKEYLEVGINET
jgi:ABC-type transporter Mla maintaining outer membrane lipid asymmetry ATPase subunit MlaF